MPIKYIEEFLNLPDINITDYLNNFHCYLPWGSSYELANGLKSSVVVRASPQQMFKCFFAANAKSEKTKKFAMDTRFYSDKRLHQTDNQFFLTIDEAVRACGSVSDIEKWREEYVAFDHEKLNEFQRIQLMEYLQKLEIG